MTPQDSAAQSGSTGGAATSASATTTAATSNTPAFHGRTLLIHGYSADGADLLGWRTKLMEVGIPTLPIEVGNYITLNNEVTIKDLGEAFDRALRYTWMGQAGSDAFTFDAIVHSTGMLVLRQWLTSDPYPKGHPLSRIKRLKHLVGLAPATFGSPQAKQGRSWLGALVKGNKHLGPDFLNAGNQVLDGLELGSRYQWDLTHRDLLAKEPLFDTSADSPYVAVFIGNQGYDGLAKLDSPEGSDGTVRWAGCALNTRKVTVDFRRMPRLYDYDGKLVTKADGVTPARLAITPWALNRLGAPMFAVEGKNHGTIVSDPDDTLANNIKAFFGVQSAADNSAWEQRMLAASAPALSKMDAASKEGFFAGILHPKEAHGGAGWQQLVVHVMDARGDGVTDYNLQLFVGDDLGDSDVDEATNEMKATPVPLMVDTYSGDASYRCFYVKLSPEMLTLNTEGNRKKLWIELIASSGSSLIEYEAYTDAGDGPHSLTVNHAGGAPVKLEVTALAQTKDMLLYPYTTTLLEIYVEREPTPLQKVSDIFNFLAEA